MVGSARHGDPGLCLIVAYMPEAQNYCNISVSSSLSTSGSSIFRFERTSLRMGAACSTRWKKEGPDARAATTVVVTHEPTMELEESTPPSNTANKAVAFLKDAQSDSSPCRPLFGGPVPTEGVESVITEAPIVEMAAITDERPLGPQAADTAAAAAPQPAPVLVPNAERSSEVCTSECACAASKLDSMDPSGWLAALPEDLRATETCWREKLTDLQFKVLRMKGTEDIHTGEYNEHFEEGMYVCSGCDQPLYDWKHKFSSGHGWPAFSDNYEGALTRHGKGKVEITCSGCGAHIGHVFRSSRYPKPKNERHCSNSVSLRFVPRTAAGA